MLIAKTSKRDPRISEYCARAFLGKFLPGNKKLNAAYISTMPIEINVAMPLEIAIHDAAWLSPSRMLQDIAQRAQLAAENNKEESPSLKFY